MRALHLVRVPTALVFHVGLKQTGARRSKRPFKAEQFSSTATRAHKQSRRQWTTGSDKRMESGRTAMAIISNSGVGAEPLKSIFRCLSPPGTKLGHASPDQWLCPQSTSLKSKLFPLCVSSDQSRLRIRKASNPTGPRIQKSKCLAETSVRKLGRRTWPSRQRR